jgi:putative ABC transport system permease protein
MKTVHRILNLFRDDAHDREIAEELSFHIEMRTEENIRAGMPPEDARRDAERAFGNRTLMGERARDFDIPQWFDQLRQNIRYALRGIRSSRGSSAVLIASLALGIGANTAMFTVLNSLLLRELPVRDASSLYSVTLSNFCSYGWVEREDVLNHALWTELRNEQSMFTDLFAYATANLDVSRGGGEVRMVAGAYATAEMWGILGIRPVSGRFTEHADEKPGSTSAVAVLNEVFWENEYGRDSAIVGRTITIGGRPVTVIGIAPRRFFGLYVGERVDVFLPLEAAAWVNGPEDPIRNGQHWWLTAVGRLGADVSPDMARQQLVALSAPAMRRTIPDDWPKDKTDLYTRQVLNLQPAGIGFSDARESLARPLLIAFGLLGLLLMLACANIAAVQMSRGLARGREFAVRIALGASRARLGAQVFIESLLAAAAGAVIGVLLSYPGTRFLVALYSDNLRGLDIQPDLRVLAFTTVLAVVTAILFGLAPALQAMRTDPNVALRSIRGSAPPQPIREWLLAVQVALAVVLAVGALLFTGTLHRLTSQNTGLHAKNVLLMQMATGRADIDSDARGEFFRQTVDRLGAIPSVERAGASYVSPLSGQAWQFGVTVDAGGTPRSQHTFVNFVTPGYFDVYGTPIMAGRGFSERDDSGGAKVALVNQAFLKAALDGGSFTGRRIRHAGAMRLDAEIVGVVADAKYRNLRSGVPPTIYLPIAQHAEPPPDIVVALRSKGPTADVIPGLRREMERLNPEVAYILKDFDEQVADSVTNERAIAAVTGLFGLLALLLAGVGIYGVSAYAVVQRRAEVGIRMAVGASPRQVLRALFSRTGTFIAAGAIAGGLLASWSARFAQSLLFEVSPASVWIYTLAAGALILVGAAAIAGPAWRAARLDPMVTLRSD